MAGAGRHYAVIALVLVVVLGGGCTRSELEREARRLLGGRVRSVTVRAQEGRSPALVVKVKLTRGPASEAAACDLLRMASADVSANETVAVSYVAPRSDGAADLVAYDWSAGNGRLVRLEGRAPDRNAEGLTSLDAVAYADGVGFDELKSFGSGASQPTWQPWPPTADTSTAQ